MERVKETLIRYMTALESTNTKSSVLLVLDQSLEPEIGCAVKSGDQFSCGDFPIQGLLGEEACSFTKVEISCCYDPLNILYTKCKVKLIKLLVFVWSYKAMFTLLFRITKMLCKTWAVTLSFSYLSKRMRNAWLQTSEQKGIPHFLSEWTQEHNFQSSSGTSLTESDRSADMTLLLEFNLMLPQLCSASRIADDFSWVPFSLHCL